MAWHTYAYAFARYCGFENEPTKRDPDRRWYSVRLINLAFEALYVNNPQFECHQLYHSCSNRWNKRGFICRPSCRDEIPEYETLSDEEAYRRFGNQGLPRKLKPSLTPAEFYRAKGDIEMAEHCERQDAERAAAWKPDYAWKDALGNPTPEALAYAELCVRQAKVNGDMFLARQPKPRPGPSQLARMQRELGLDAKERE